MVSKDRENYQVMNEVLENQTADYFAEVGWSMKQEEMASLQGAPER